MNQQMNQQQSQNQFQAQVIQKSTEQLEYMIDLVRYGKEQDFSYQDLSGMNLSELKLIGSKFVGANLAGCDLNATNLTGCDLSDANLTSATLEDGFLENTNLSGANLSGADLRENYLENTNFSNANLSNVNFYNCVILPDCNWDNANLKGAYYGFDDPDFFVNLPREKIYMTKPPTIFYSKTDQEQALYKVLIFDKFIKIGCQLRSYREWLEMSLATIEELDDGDALMFNKLHREILIELADAHGCLKD